MITFFPPLTNNTHIHTMNVKLLYCPADERGATRGLWVFYTNVVIETAHALEYLRGNRVLVHTNFNFLLKKTKKKIQQ